MKTYSNEESVLHIFETSNNNFNIEFNGKVLAIRKTFKGIMKVAQSYIERYNLQEE